MSLSGQLRVLAGLAETAGERALAMREAGLTTEYKPGDRSPVTNADLAVDAFLKAELTALDPDAGWLSEETVDDPRRLTRRRLFVVDPIDGTRAFVKGAPWWGVSIAVVEDGRPVLGVVHAPQLKETYIAEAGKGAFLGDKPIQPSDAGDLENCEIIGDAQALAQGEWPTPWPTMRFQSRNSIAYRLCLVASGVFDVALTLTPKNDWDLAAGDLIAKEAGAFVGDHQGHEFIYNRAQPMQKSLVCAAPGLAPLILERVAHIAG
ncbi:MAG TPA: 3'(2'),5'-bisphosphate nucleotidase CysQ [Phenylobacterium sp.]|nr:3'(2'),5'-bisphosphate nucleotidase CysQ [Phenylobacterium sp.]